MKKYFVLASLFVSQIALAHVIEVNKDERTVFYTPDVVLDVEVTDLDSEGGMFSLSLSYDSAAVKSEEENLKRTYPGYALRVLTAQHASSSLLVSIPEIGLSEETQVKQGQMGPYLNFQTLLKPAQVAKLKTLSASATDLVKLAIPVSSGYQAIRVLEKYSSSTVCKEMRVKRFDDLVVALFNLKKPSGIVRAETLTDYKRSIIEGCFDLSPAKVTSFKELMALELQPKESPIEITARYSTSQWVDAKYELVPKLRLKIN
ncbi:hypothetical protein [Bdellovibrio sp. HCB337]|uniref:hypothetical protein n=1 Tax=Bdellovibrio sp. HCB337 TaxID=3394358 RepID=UPI0039A6763F